ncbi:hypothetical protein ACFSAG_00675 [Sphingorhabdus buctiana]|jgi:hypothetical protein|uniref:ABC transporter permease n=2 Tax=Sphingorhabdus buctiana TaxID=1508805 RepID=A0ABW4MC40_9SPHN
MGFFQILRSIEDLLYQVMTWLVFYPRTMWQVIRHPVSMIDYSDKEQGDTPEQQYIDTLSPPLFLLLTILLSHVIELGFQTRIDTPKEGLGRYLTNSEENLLILRSVLFSIYPLVFAVGMLKRTGTALDTISLRAPFFSQCYVGAVFALLMSIATILFRSGMETMQWASLGLLLLTIIWYISIQTEWFAQHLTIGRRRAAGIATLTFVKASVINSALASLVLV